MTLKSVSERGKQLIKNSSPNASDKIVEPTNVSLSDVLVAVVKPTSVLHGF